MTENNWIHYERLDDRQPQFLFQHEETGRLVAAVSAPSERWYRVSLRELDQKESARINDGRCARSVKKEANAISVL